MKAKILVASLATVLGVIEEGAYADLIVIDGNPLKDIKILEDYEKNMKVIVRDGKVWKNTLK